ncbi:glycosyl hydrolase family 28 protein [Paenibacillus glycanilyticus]|uniref:Glycoside hydrolase n=1 Tax=Paenibacillus glycanilyticus TaxID=126569 RepID=A0ABQ6GKX3_9BACL|nr:glycosyl hydrolase family 28 protein [Paenibacillus glycanilyticus]GLX71488.1 hypothetical protein MU1_58380 [Paenibacillus glycanilyticus]
MSLRLHEKPEGIAPSPDYTLKINGEEAFVYHIPGMAGGAVSYASFDFEGIAKIEITSAWNVESAEVRPQSYGIPSKLVGNTVLFEIDRPCQLFVKWNDQFELPFYLFANGLEDEPSADAEGIKHYFGPGIHNGGNMTLSSGESVYLAAGAFVHGTIHAEFASNVKIYGRGILCASDIPFGTPEGYPTEVVGFNACNNIEVSGITIIDSFGWTLVGYDCDNMLVSNVKIINERKWSTDGINPCNCRDVRIERCFVRSKDDCVAVKGLQASDRFDCNWSPLTNIHVVDCVFWSDNNNGIVVGCENKAQIIENIRFENCDLLKVSNTCGDIAGALSVIAIDDTVIRDITFEHIRIEHAAGPLFNVFFAESMFSGQIVGSFKPEGGVIDNIAFRSISVTGGPARRSYVRGMGNNRTISNVTFEQVSIHGESIKTPQQMKLVVNEFAEGVQIL